MKLHDITSGVPEHYADFLRGWYHFYKNDRYQLRYHADTDKFDYKHTSWEAPERLTDYDVEWFASEGKRRNWTQIAHCEVIS